MAVVPPVFVGREREAAGVSDALRRGVVVTLTGPGGVGKTSLAAYVAQGAGGDVRWCDLARATAGSTVALAVADALGGGDIPSDAVERELPALVAGRRLLVVLDNCEHVAADAAAIASRMAGEPGVRVLATSRESLGLPEERVVALAPLALPADDRLETVRASETGRLFEERAAAVRTGFALRDDNAADVARLCRRLDGLPLALELAAAWARSLTPREIADRLDERFALLARRKGEAEDRHRSLRAAVDWSYELLSAPERALFERLAVFSSSVALPEVEAIAGPGALLLLDALVDRSLVTTREHGGVTRYGMLETLREYARERLVARRELGPLRDHHADHYAAVADDLRLERLPAGAAAASLDFSRVDEHLSAVRWCIENDTGPERAFRLLAPLWVVVHSRSAAEITDLAERALGRWEGRADTLAVGVLGVAAVGNETLCRWERARARASEAIAAEAGSAPALIARRSLAFTAFVGHDRGEAERLLTELAALAEAQGAVWVALEAAGLRTTLQAFRGDVDGALALAASLPPRAESWGAPQLVAWTTLRLGIVQLGWGSPAEARATFERCLALARRLESPLLVPLARGQAVRHLGVVAALEREPARSAELLSEAFAHFRSAGDRTQCWDVLRSAAVALAAAGRREPAERILAAADATPTARALGPLEEALLDRLLPDPQPAPGWSGGLDETARMAFDALAAWRPHAAQPAAGAVFRRDGPLWTLAFAGTVVRLPHLKGLSDLAALLAVPGREVHCLDLAADGPALQGGDLGDVVDATARTAYRVRAEELAAEIEDARRANDPIRLERAQDELAAIAGQLEAAYGLAGRGRRAGDPAERARTAVTARIRNAIGKVEAQHPALGRHLRNAVRTGTWCVYAPETAVDWEL